MFVGEVKKLLSSESSSGLKSCLDYCIGKGRQLTKSKHMIEYEQKVTVEKVMFACCS